MSKSIKSISTGVISAGHRQFAMEVKNNRSSRPEEQSSPNSAHLNIFTRSAFTLIELSAPE